MSEDKDNQNNTNALTQIFSQAVLGAGETSMPAPVSSSTDQSPDDPLMATTNRRKEEDRQNFEALRDPEGGSREGFIPKMNLPEGHALSGSGQTKKEKEKEFLRLLDRLTADKLIDLLNDQIQNMREIADRGRELAGRIQTQIDRLEDIVQKTQDRHKAAHQAIEDGDFERNEDGSFKNKAVQELVENWKKRTGQDLPENLDPTMLLILLQDQMQFESDTLIPSIMLELDRLGGIQADVLDQTDELDEKAAELERKRDEILDNDDLSAEQKEQALKDLIESADLETQKALQKLDELKGSFDTSYEIVTEIIREQDISNAKATDEQTNSSLEQFSKTTENIFEGFGGNGFNM